MRLLRFLISHSVFISLCAAALCYQTGILLGISVSEWVYLLVFSCTLGGYNLYWLISKFSFGNRSLKNFFANNLSNILLLFLSAIGSGIALINKPDLWPHLLAGIALTLLYALPLLPRISAHFKRFGFLKTTLLAFTWTYITISFPVAGAEVDGGALYWLAIARFSFLLMLCAIFDMRDASVDKVRAFHSLATDISPRRLRHLMIISFALFLAAGMRLRVFTNNDIHLIAFAITALATWVVYRMSLQRNRGYYFYYFFVDGLMMFSSLLTIVAHFG